MLSPFFGCPLRLFRKRQGFRYIFRGVESSQSYSFLFKNGKAHEEEEEDWEEEFRNGPRV